MCLKVSTKVVADQSAKLGVMCGGSGGMKTNAPSEAFWMAVSVLASPDEALLEALGGVPSKDSHSKISEHGTNADHLLWLLQEYKIYWAADFGELPTFRELERHLDKPERPDISHLEDLGGNYWRTLRNLASELLKETGLEEWPIRGSINFYDYIELQD